MKPLSGLISASLFLFLSGIVSPHYAIAGAMPDENNRSSEETGASASQAIEMLLDSAADYVEQKDFDKAAAALERALRIEPQNAEIWHLLAQVRLHQGQYQQAEAMAAKSNSYATQQPSLQERNQHVIAVARQLAAGEEVTLDALAQTPTAPERTIVIEKYSVIAETEKADIEPLTDSNITSDRLTNASGFSEQTVHMIAQPRFAVEASPRHDQDIRISRLRNKIEALEQQLRHSAPRHIVRDYDDEHRHRHTRSENYHLISPNADYIPDGQLPPPGECRIWYHDRPAGHQPPPDKCRKLRHRVPHGARLIYG